MSAEKMNRVWFDIWRFPVPTICDILIIKLSKSNFCCCSFLCVVMRTNEILISSRQIYIIKCKTAQKVTLVAYWSICLAELTVRVFNTNDKKSDNRGLSSTQHLIRMNRLLLFYFVPQILAVKLVRLQNDKDIYLHSLTL